MFSVVSRFRDLVQDCLQFVHSPVVFAIFLLVWWRIFETIVKSSFRAERVVLRWSRRIMTGARIVCTARPAWPQIFGESQVIMTTGYTHGVQRFATDLLRI